MGRFVNADRSDFVSRTGNNLFLYCYNAPTTFDDHYGYIAKGVATVAALCGVALLVTTLALSVAMYAYAATGARLDNDIDLSAWWNPIGSIMRDRLENSKLVKERINSYIGNLYGDAFSKKEHINFKDKKKYPKDLDLFLSVGNADNCTIRVTKTGKRRWFSSKYIYKVKIVLSDKYDFDKFKKEEKGLIITAINNVLGYYPMEWGILKKYDWKIQHEFDYCY